MGTVAAALVVTLVGYHLGRPGFMGSPVSDRPAPALVMPDDNGGIFDLAQQHGGLVLIYFGYRNCPDVCPTTLADLRAVMDALGSDAAMVSVVFVTLDPHHDTPAAVRDYLSSFTPIDGRSFIGLVGGTDDTAAAAARWGVTWRSTDDGRFIDHTSVVTVIDLSGHRRLRFGAGQTGDPKAVARDLRALLHGA